MIQLTKYIKIVFRNIITFKESTLPDFKHIVELIVALHFNILPETPNILFDEKSTN